MALEVPNPRSSNSFALVFVEDGACVEGGSHGDPGSRERAAEPDSGLYNKSTVRTAF